MKPVEDPLTETRPPEVPLTRAPLIRVLTQVRFPVVASVEKQEFIGPFQEAIRKEYGVLRREQSVGFSLGAAGATPAGQSISNDRQPIKTKDLLSATGGKPNSNWRV